MTTLDTIAAEVARMTAVVDSTARRLAEADAEREASEFGKLAAEIERMKDLLDIAAGPDDLADLIAQARAGGAAARIAYVDSEIKYRHDLRRLATEARCRLAHTIEDLHRYAIDSANAAREEHAARLRERLAELLAAEGANQ